MTAARGRNATVASECMSVKDGFITSVACLIAVSSQNDVRVIYIPMFNAISRIIFNIREDGY